MAQASFFSRLAEVWCTGKVDDLDNLLPADVTYHFPPFPDMDRAGLQQFITGFRRAFPDFTVTIEHELVDGDHTAARWNCSGTFSGELPLLSASPTNKGFHTYGGHFVLWRDDRPVELWHNADWLGGLQQCGVLPPLG